MRREATWGIVAECYCYDGWFSSQTLLRGLQPQKFPTSNTYMDDPFQERPPQQDQHIYSNSSVLEHQVPSAEHQPS